MKPALEYLPKEAEESFVVKDFDYAYYPTPWHFHPEYEIVLVTESTGKRFIGDAVSNFEPGDLALIGPNLPHLYRNESNYYQPESPLRAKSIVVHFLETSFGTHFLNLPEAKEIKKLMEKSNRGLHITGITNQIISAQLFELVALKGFSRWLKLLEILHTLAVSEDYHYISNASISGQNELESERMDQVLQFVLKNFNQEISLKNAADIANMAENSFSRYFSQRTRKSFTAYVNEIRLSHACKLLIENQKSVAEICFDCGFETMSNFNRQFKRHYQMNPLAYRKLYLNKL